MQPTRFTMVSVLTLLVPLVLSLVVNNHTNQGHNALDHRGRRLDVPAQDRRNATDLGLTKRENTKYVFMHHIVGNTYPYTAENWKTDVTQIAAKGVDAIALNIGNDGWQFDRLHDAYKAAEGTNMKMFISFDFTAFDCSNADKAIEWFNTFKTYSSQFYYNGKPMLSSYAGSCMSSSEWQRIKAATDSYLMPFMWGLEDKFNTEWSFLDSWLCWGCAWPQKDTIKTVDDDRYYMSQLGSRYATTVSMWIYTHYSWADKNFYLRGDEWLIATRWEQLFEMRNELTFVEMTTWNDWGESNYFGPFGGAQPEGTYWAENFPHTAFFELSQYYIAAFKTGSYPTIIQDAIYYWARPHSMQAEAPQDSLGKPKNHDWAKDYMEAVVMATSDAVVTLGIGSYSEEFNVEAGVSKLRIGLQPGQMIVQMVRNGQSVIYQSPTDFSYSDSTDKYNYNVYASTATGPVGAEYPTSPTDSGSTPLPSNTAWSYYGCVAEGNTGNRRALASKSSKRSDMTPDRCMTFCKDYDYAGLEYKSECYCGNAPTGHGATGEVIDSARCNQPCVGDSSKMCGGEWTLTVYSRSIAVSTTGTPTTSDWTDYGCVTDSWTRALGGPSFTQEDMTPLRCQDLCKDFTYAGTEYHNECHCGNSIKLSGSSGSLTSPSECSLICSGDSSELCGGEWRMSVYRNSRGTTVSKPWTNRGCYTDSNDRILRDAFTELPGSMTTETCIQHCVDHRFTIAATEYMYQCMCGNLFYKTDGAGSSVESSECNLPCSGDNSQNCGSEWRANVYTAPGTTLTR